MERTRSHCGERFLAGAIVVAFVAWHVIDGMVGNFAQLTVGQGERPCSRIMGRGEARTAALLTSPGLSSFHLSPRLPL